MLKKRNDLKLKRWYTILFEINNSAIEIYFEESLDLKYKRTRISLFDKIIEKLPKKGVFLGFTVNKGSLGIDRFRMSPGRIPPPEKEEEEEEEDEEEEGTEEGDDGETEDEVLDTVSCEESGTCQKFEYDY